MRHALDRGVNHLDSSDMYGWGHNETLLGEALAGPWRARAFLATKFGQFRREGGQNGVDGSPAYVAAACEASLKRLRTEVIDLYYQHRVDPAVPIEETVGAMARLVEQGKVRFLGLSEAAPETIRRAQVVNLANGILRHRFGLANPQRSLAGPAFLAKKVLQRAMRDSGWINRARAARRPVTFTLEKPSATSADTPARAA